MRKLYMLCASALSLCFLWSGVAHAGEIYKWTTDDGQVAFTDDADRIPERYRASATRRSQRNLANYERYTQRLTSADSGLERVQARLEHLRAFNADVAGSPTAPKAASRGPVGETVIQVDDRTAVRIPSQSEDAAPIVVEEVRVKRDGALFTQHHTVVRQGDKVLMVVRPAQPHQAGPNDFVDEDALLPR